MKLFTLLFYRGLKTDSILKKFLKKFYIYTTFFTKI